MAGRRYTCYDNPPLVLTEDEVIDVFGIGQKIVSEMIPARANHLAATPTDMGKSVYCNRILSYRLTWNTREAIMNTREAIMAQIAAN